MAASLRSIAPGALMPRLRRRLCPSLFAAALIAAASGSAEARTARGPGPYAGSLYDGTWNVVFATTQGNCGSGYSVPFAVSRGRVFSAGGGRVSGVVGRGGSVAVSVSVGSTRASGGGRLTGNFGAGGWRGIISGSPCRGTWQATHM